MPVALVVLALFAAAPAQAGVRIVAPFDPADYADRAAVGLLVPGAGPTVTREAALAALLRARTGSSSERRASQRSSSRCRPLAGPTTTSATRSHCSGRAAC